MFLSSKKIGKKTQEPKKGLARYIHKPHTPQSMSPVNKLYHLVPSIAALEALKIAEERETEEILAHGGYREKILQALH